MAPRFEVLPYLPEHWDSLLKASEEGVIFQSSAWLSFLQETQKGTPVLAGLQDGSRPLGYFLGMVVKKFGLKILGSPFPGWMTDYMGFNLLPGVARRVALEALQDLAFHQLKCIHLECMDQLVTSEDCGGLGYQIRLYPSYQIELSKNENEIFEKMSGACRRCIRKSEREGVVVEEANDIEFADEYYAQLKEVFAKRSLVPTYDIDRVRALIEHLLPTGQLLLLRARNTGGDCIATGIFPAMNQTMHFWGGASWKKYQHLRPNEALHWHAMRYWKSQGIKCYDMGGGGDYKKKFGGHRITTPWLRMSKYSWIAGLRDFAKRAVRCRQQFLGKTTRLS